MRFCEFEKIMSSKRMTRYVNACGGDTRKGMKLYRITLFSWMGIDGKSLLYGMDHVKAVSQEIESMK